MKHQKVGNSLLSRLRKPLFPFGLIFLRMIIEKWFGLRYDRFLTLAEVSR